MAREGLWRRVGLACAVVLSAVWLGAASYKLLNASIYKNAGALLAPSWLPSWASEVAVRALPGIEVVIGVALLIPRARRQGAVTSLLVIAALTVLALGRYQDGALALAGCGCNWPFVKWLAPTTVVGFVLRNATLVVLSGATLMASPRHCSVVSQDPEPT